MQTSQRPQPPFWQRFLITTGIAIAASLALALIIILVSGLIFNNESGEPPGSFGDRFWALSSNTLFLASFILLIIAVIPIFSEVGSGARNVRRAVVSGQKVGKLSEEETAKHERGWHTTIQFSLAAVLCFVLAILTLGM